MTIREKRHRRRVRDMNALFGAFATGRVSYGLGVWTWWNLRRYIKPLVMGEGSWQKQSA